MRTQRQSARFVILTTLVLACLPALAAWPAPYMNYQGVLRDSGGNPLDGTYEMVFRFYSGLGEEILIDRHTVAQGGTVTVSDGLFNVPLGAGATADGSGPGTYGSLEDVFRDHNEVHLEVQIGADGAPGTEVLSPRTRVMSAAYALNASNLAGLAATSLLRSDESDEYTFGTLTFYPATTLDVDGALHMDGAVTKTTTNHVANFNADLLDNLDSSAFAVAAHGHVGGEITGPVAAAANADMLDGHDSTFYVDTSTVSQAKIGPFIANASTTPGATGITGRGPAAGGLFTDSDGTGVAYLGYNHSGIEAFGAGTGGYFEDTNASAITYVAVENIGIDARGDQAGGYFKDVVDSGEAYVGYGHVGISALGNTAGGYFEDANNHAFAYVGYGTTGIEARGSLRGGHFRDSDGTSYAYVGNASFGISAYGNTAGGYFDDLDATGSAYVGYGDRGIEASGSDMGGYFSETDSVAEVYLAYSDLGVWGYGSWAGGRFEDTDGTGTAYLGIGHTGISALGSETGGTFADIGESGTADVAIGNRGIWARGSFAGGTFSSPNGTTFWSDVATPTHKIAGTGADGFVQNHPYDENRVLYYTAPEGDEVAVYTRGTARLVAGEATVPLGETFRWVANPDIGLTAHLTSHGDCMGLYIASLGVEELIVRELGGGTSDVVFDYIVYGLRIGFEELAVVDTKVREAPLPATEVFGSKYAADPALRKFNALERYKVMTADVRGVAVDAIEMNGANTLRAAILAAGRQHLGTIDPDRKRAERFGNESPASPGEPTPTPETIQKIAPDHGVAESDEHDPVIDVPGLQPLFPVSEPLEPGDLLALDPERPGTLVRTTSALDPGIVGIAADIAGEVDGQLRVALVETNYAVVKADAGFGAIRPGDLLTSSFTPGHAMRAGEVVPGTIIGKALEPLSTGTGLIKVLVMPR